jgi:hypothetical protein
VNDLSACHVLELDSEAFGPTAKLVEHLRSSYEVIPRGNPIDSKDQLLGQESHNRHATGQDVAIQKAHGRMGQGVSLVARPRRKWVALSVIGVLFFGFVSMQSVPAQTPKTGSALPALSTIPGRFVDITERSGVHFQHQAPHTSRKYLNETMGSGVALFDYDNDGRLDLYLVNGAFYPDPTPKGFIPQKTGPEYWNRMYHQKPDGTFEDITVKSGLQGVGYGMGVAVADYDNDGYEDVFVTGYGGNRLYHNNGDCTFSDVTEKAGVGGSGWSSSAAWVDLDNDGVLDLVVLRYVTWEWEDMWCGPQENRGYCHPDVFQPISMLVYHNDGNGHFTEVSHKLGLNKPAKALGIAIADYDIDGRMDIFVANDSMPRSCSIRRRMEPSKRSASSRELP